MNNKTISASMRERKRMSFALEVKSIHSDGRFAGYASVFDIVDNQKDIMLKGAFADTLKKGAGAIKLLWQHQQDEPIGVFDKMFEDAVGLYVEGRLLLDVQKGREAFTLLKSGAVTGLSIGYSPTRYRIDATTGVRLLAEVDLFEVSLVTFPANEQSKVTVVSSSPNRGEVRRGASKAYKKLSSKNASTPALPLMGRELLGEELIALQKSLDQAILALRP